MLDLAYNSTREAKDLVMDWICVSIERVYERNRRQDLLKTSATFNEMGLTP